MKRRILICGGREYNDSATFEQVMKYLKQWFAQDFCIIHGQARGADRLAAAWAFFEGCPMIVMPANWEYYGKAAGHIRNSWMLKYALPDLVVAFPGGRGTENMIRQARCANIDVFEVK